MLTINLLKSEHGLREKFLKDADLKKRCKFIAVRMFTATLILLLSYMLFNFTGDRIFAYLSKVDEHYEEPVEVFSMPDPGGEEIEIPHRERYVEPADNKVIKGEESGKSSEKRKLTSELKISKVRVATIIVRSNAVSLKNRLKKAGFPALIKPGEAVIPFRRLSYSGLSGQRLKKVLAVFKKYSIDYTSKTIGGTYAVFSKEIFIPATQKGVISELKEFSISGSQKSGRGSVKVFRVFLDGFFGKDEVKQKMSRLISLGFSPVVITVE